MEKHMTNEQEAEHSRAVRDMFAGIAPKYDFLNHFLSLNIDRRWRRKVRAELSQILACENALVLDVACGTGDLTLELRTNAKATIIGTDFCRPMLTIAQTKSSKKASGISYVEADAMQLPFTDVTFDAVTIGFGFRNLPNLENGLDELYRILKPGGRLVILEFSSPNVPGFGALFNLYFAHILPRIGGAVSGSRQAYTYLPNSVSKFPDQKSLRSMMTRAGFSDVNYASLTGGIVAIHHGIKN